jgi:glycosyltransferase involved in cell wall biosynthesis
MVDLQSPFVSVLIPVFNDAEHLKICLDSLENQTYPKNLYEVIVIDNGSDTCQDIKGIVAQFKQARATYESLPGSYAARNKGIISAKGEVIAFTDADCIPAHDWIAQGVKSLLSIPNCGLVAGKINTLYKDSNKPTMVELYESIMALPQKEFIEKYKYGATANVFTFKSVIDHVGSFDSTLKSSGDFEWGQRVFSCGYQQVYADDACVSHHARHSFQQLYKKTIRYTGGRYDLQKKRNVSAFEFHKEFLEVLVKDFMSLPLVFIFHIFIDSRFKQINFKQRITISYVIFIVRIVNITEKIRLKLGGKSTRE